MNYVYGPRVAATIAAEVNFISPVKGVREILLESDPAAATNELMFPPEEILDRLHPYPALSPADERAMRERMAQVVRR
jgi:spermidine/putrescine transport system substrate-binding protein